MAAAYPYAKAVLSLGQGKFAFATDTLKVMLLQSYAVADTQLTAQYVSNVLAVAVEASGAGYTAGGQTLTGVVWTKPVASGATLLGCDTPTWTGLTTTATHALFYDSTPATTATQPVITYLDLGGTTAVTTGTLTLAVDPTLGLWEVIS